MRYFYNRTAHTANRIPKIILFLHVLLAHIFMLQAQDTNLPVGAIPGAVDVSPMGAATYTIPIEVVPGTQGMQPNLSIVYNSMGGMGLLGMKWGLSGLSAITRCGQIPYYDDDNITSIQFDSNDKFALDGSRLVQMSGSSYGEVGASYAAEMEDFTRIYSYNGTSGFPEYFKAFTDNGNIIEYGNTSDSKQSVFTNKILSWFVNKITDAEGNYMTFHYRSSATKEIWIDSIKYTGNTTASILPYSKVVFDYRELPDTLGQNTFFVGGYGIPQTKLLETISVYYGNSVVRKYEFNYNTNVSGERTAHLKEMVLKEYNETGTEKQLNPTTIEWGGKNCSIKIDTISGLPQSGKILTGDFNGNGYADLLFYNTVSTGKGWTLYLYNPAQKTFLPQISNTYTTYDYIYAQDLNGDGIHELIIGTVTSSGNSPVLKYTFSIYSLEKGYAELITSTVVSNLVRINFGDFDGSGSTDFMFTSVDASGYYNLFRKLENTVIKPIGTLVTCSAIPQGVFDFNGNGNKNFSVKKNDGQTDVYEFRESDFVKFDRGYVSIPFSSWNGDITGNGITDFLKFDESNITWKLYIGVGDGTYNQTTIPNGALANDTLFKPILADLNGDGKVDIVQGVYNSITDSTTFIVLLSKGLINNTYKFSKKTITVKGKYDNTDNWFLSDFYSDGRYSLLIENTNNAQPLIISVSQDKDYEFVQEITDGIGKTTQFHYKHKYIITENLQQYGHSYSRTYKKCFLPIVDSIRVSNGFGTGLNTLKYKFHTPVYSLPRRTFLGFNEFVCINSSENKRDSLSFNFKDYSFSAYYQILQPLEQRSFCNNKIISVKRFGTFIQPLDNGCFVYKGNPSLYNYISDSFTKTTNTINNKGRVIESATGTYWGSTPNPSKLALLEDNTYYFKGVCLSEEHQKKTVLTKVITTQKYEANGVVITDTATYDYTTNARLASSRKANIDGAITTAYGNYTTAGLCGSKTISAQGCDPRTETYTYDATQRFVTQITNPLNHSAQFSHNPKTGNKISETDANGLTTNYYYDTFGNLTKITYPDGTQTKDTVYWFSGSNPPNACYCTKTSSSGKADLIVHYDKLGREVRRQDDDYYYDIRYNTKGQIEKTSYPYSNMNTLDNNKIWSYFTYDVLGRDSTKIAPYTNLTYAYDLIDKRKVTVIDNIRKVETWKDHDALGRLVAAHDEGGDIIYSYSVTPAKRHKTVIIANTDTTTILSDLWGNRLSITEPNAGTINSVYNGFNELITQIDARGSTTGYEYDLIGRVTQKQYLYSKAPIQTIKYLYDESILTDNAKGKLCTIKINNSREEDFVYDSLSRLSKHYKYDCGAFNYTYNANGQLHTLKYPGLTPYSFEVVYSYTSAGKLKDIRRSSDNKLIYEVSARNEFGATTRCSFGNDLATVYTYNPFGILTRINTGNKISVGEEGEVGLENGPGNGGYSSYTADSTILNYHYAYNNRGIMTSRSESIINLQETYNYDYLDRLTSVTSGQVGQQGITQSFSYHNNGNMSLNDMLGNYYYDNTKKHAVTTITPVNQTVISPNECAVIYNLFNQPDEITEDDTRLNLYYGANLQRKKMETFRNDTLRNRHIYYNKYTEHEYDYMNDTTTTLRRYFYIYGDNGVVGMYLATRTGKDTAISYNDSLLYDKGLVTTDSLYYIHPDHLGSYVAITNAAKQVRQRNWFDPWGNFIPQYAIIVKRGIDPAPIMDTVLANFPLTRRGFTGHEHYPELKIINMNGRLYDPVIGRFFSPDKFVANSSFTQDFNRYTYARNCPLMYSDPDGEFVQYIVWGLHYLFTGLQNMLDGVNNPWQDAKQQANGFVNGVNNMGKITIYQDDYFNVNAGLDMFAFGVSINASYTTTGGTTLGASAGYSFMGGFYIGGFINQQIGDWNVGAGIGGGNNHWGWNANMTYKRYGIGYGKTYYGNAIGPDGIPNHQYTGTLSFYTPYSTFRMENDVWGDGLDRWRTSAYEATFGPFVIGTNVYTNSPDLDIARDDKYRSKIWGNNKNDRYTYADSKVYSSPFYIGLKQGNSITRIGINHPGVQDLIQNGWHKYVSKSPYFYTPYGEYCSPYFYTGYYNLFSLYY